MYLDLVLNATHVKSQSSSCAFNSSSHSWDGVGPWDVECACGGHHCEQKEVVVSASAKLHASMLQSLLCLSIDDAVVVVSLNKQIPRPGNGCFVVEVQLLTCKFAAVKALEATTTSHKHNTTQRCTVQLRA